MWFESKGIVAHKLSQHRPRPAKARKKHKIALMPSPMFRWNGLVHTGGGNKILKKEMKHLCVGLTCGSLQKPLRNKCVHMRHSVASGDASPHIYCSTGHMFSMALVNSTTLPQYSVFHFLKFRVFLSHKKL